MVNHKEIAKFFKVSRSSVYQIVKKFIEYGVVGDLHRSGRPLKFESERK